MHISLYERIGGDPGVNALVSALMQRLLNDPVATALFDGVDMEHLVRHQRSYIGQILHDVPSEELPDLTQAHAHLVRERGLSHDHFQRMIECLRLAVLDIGFTSELAKEIVDRVARLEGKVLGASR